MLGDQLFHQGDAFGGGGDGGVDEETARSQFDHRHPDWGDDVEYPLELIEGPDLAGDDFLSEGLALAEGVDWEEGPEGPGPVWMGWGCHGGGL